jgi:hypothetical protein
VLAAGPVLIPRLLDLKGFIDGFLTQGRRHAHGVILFESMRPLWPEKETEFAPGPAL